MPFYSNKSIQKIGPMLRSGKVNYWSGNEGKKLILKEKLSLKIFLFNIKNQELKP